MPVKMGPIEMRSGLVDYCSEALARMAGALNGA